MGSYWRLGYKSSDQYELSVLLWHRLFRRLVQMGHKPSHQYGTHVSFGRVVFGRFIQMGCQSGDRHAVHVQQRRGIFIRFVQLEYAPGRQYESPVLWRDLLFVGFVPMEHRKCSFHGRYVDGNHHTACMGSAYIGGHFDSHFIPEVGSPACTYARAIGM